MNIIIVGSGLCGLTAGILLRRSGHSVRIFERTSTSTAFGAGLVLGHNATAVMERCGIDYTRARMNIGNDLKVYNGVTLEQISSFPMDTPQYELVPGRKQYFVHRVDLQEELVRVATDPDRAGPPIEFRYNSNVTSYDPEGGSITLATGETYIGDLVIAADGVYSSAPSFILGHESPALFTGTSIVRFMLPTSAIKSDPETAGIVEYDGQTSNFLGPDRSRHLLRYPVRNNELSNFGMYTINSATVDNAARIEDQIHRFQCDQASLARELEGFHSSILALVPKTTEVLPVWRLVERDPLPTWCKGRLVAIGDSVHPMLPNQGQGAGMAVEDSGALSECFRDMPDHSKETIVERLALFERIRKGRASVVQLLSSVPYFENNSKLWPRLQEFMAQDELPKTGKPVDVRPWLFRYDVMDESRRLVEEHLQKRKGVMLRPSDSL